MKKLFFVLIIITYSFNSNNLTEQNKFPKNGFVPDEETAIKVAEAILIPIYGERVLMKRPFIAELKGDIWYIKGTLPEEYTVGGVPYVEIQKSDCKILEVYHTK